MTRVDVFVSKTRRTPRGCVEWQGSKNNHGYGWFYVNGRNELTHRVSYRVFIGPIPDGLEVCHTCDNPACVSPGHLWVGTHAQNMADSKAKDRVSRAGVVGVANGSAKLTPEKVRDVRRRVAAGESMKGVARSLGVQFNVVWSIMHGVTWKEVT